ncbi:DUF5522 domain-containing protein [Algoriphagus aquimarinus]|uniref:DUF5522 domain-containing protein n=1 Tax=Algoriphagus aquimarinus TaxID=237018 RepID=UPI000B8969FF|tara:strand:+ start:49351 stop:49554 length:204 start_codon:yes stop_codon:yes gene_type:complete
MDSSSSNIANAITPTMKDSKKPLPTSALSSEDFYFNEQGLMVFTKKYHLKRGYCCGSGCKNCPYPKD